MGTEQAGNYVKEGAAKDYEWEDGWIERKKGK